MHLHRSELQVGGQRHRHPPCHLLNSFTDHSIQKFNDALALVKDSFQLHSLYHSTYTHLYYPPYPLLPLISTLSFFANMRSRVALHVAWR